METPVTIHAQPPITEEVRSSKLPVVIALIVVTLAGIGTGYLLTLNRKSSADSNTSSNAMIKSADEAGTLDTKTFKDYATGTLKEGGINGEGTHKLIRPGGDSQTVYLISSLVDLGPFIDKNVEVYGQTIKAKSAGWLMDVGRIKVVQ